MSQETQAILAMREGVFEDAQMKGDVRHGYLDDSHGTVEVPLKDGYFYYRWPRGSSGEYEIGEARLASGVSPRPNLAVIIKVDPDTEDLTIYGVDPSGHAYSGATGGVSGLALPDHGENHEWNKHDEIALRSEQIVQNRIEPNSAVRTITIREGPYLYNGNVEWLYVPVSADLSAYYPAAGSKFVWISLGAAGAVTVTDDNISDPELLNYPTDGTYILGYVQLPASKQLVERPEIFDFRFKNYLGLQSFKKPRLLTLAGIWEEYDTVQAAITAAVSGENVYVPPKPGGGYWAERVLLKDGVDVKGIGPYGSVHIYWLDATEWRGAIYTAAAACTATISNIKITCKYDTISQLSYAFYGQHTSGMVTFKNCIIAAYPELASISNSRCVSQVGNGDVKLVNCELVTHAGSSNITLLQNSGNGNVYVVGGHAHKDDYSTAGGLVLTNSGAGAIHVGGFIFDAGYTYAEPTYLEGTDLHRIGGYATATPDPAADFLVFLDDTDGEHKKSLPNTFFSEANLVGGSLTTPRIPYASDASTLVDAAELTWNNTGKFINLNNIWRVGETVLYLDFTGTDYDTDAECAAVGVKLSDAYTLPTPIIVALASTSWSHVASSGWKPSASIDGVDGPAMYIPLARSENWEIDIEISIPTFEINSDFSFLVGYLCGSNHVGAYCDGYGAVAGGDLDFGLVMYTNDGDDTFTDRYSGAGIAGICETTITIKLKLENGVIYVWDDGDNAWHSYTGRQSTGHAYTPSALFVQAHSISGNGNSIHTVYLSSLILKYLL